MPHEKKVIGVGGRIGSGKTTVSRLFAEYGAQYISADEVGWEVLEEIKEALKTAFGNEIMRDDNIDREKLRDIVFSDVEHLKRLNGLSHPLLKEKLISRLDAIARGAVVVDAALLFSWPDILSHVDIPVLVKADDDYRERRVGEKGIDRETYLNIQNMQKSDEETEPHARYVITNNGSLEDLRMQCQKVYEEIISDC